MEINLENQTYHFSLFKSLTSSFAIIKPSIMLLSAINADWLMLMISYITAFSLDVRILAMIL